MEKIPKTKKFYFLLVTYGIVLYVALQHLDVVRGLIASFFTIMEPIAYGLGIAFIINLFMNLFRRLVFKNLDLSDVPWQKKLCTPLCALSTFFVAAGLLAAVIFLIIPQVSTAVNTLIDKTPTSSQQIFEFVNKKLVELHAPESLITQINQFNVDWKQIIKFVSDFLDGRIETLVGTAFSATASVISTFTNVILGLIIAVYILAQKERFMYVIKHLLLLVIPQKYHKESLRILNLTNESFANFITGQFLEALIIGTLCTIGLSIFRFPYAVTIGVLTGITALIPIIGAWIGGGIGALLILVDAPEKVLWFVVFIVVLQQLEGQFIYPRVVGNSLKLPGLIVLIAVILGGSFAGVVGILFAVPISAILYTLLKEMIDSNKNQNFAAETAVANVPVPAVKESAPPAPTPPPAKPAVPKQQSRNSRRKRKR